MRVVRPDLGADPVLQWGDDLAPRGVVLRVRREEEEDVEYQADGKSLDLDVPLLEDVEEADLDLAREVGKLVEREESAVCPRKEPEVDRQLVGQKVAAAGCLDRVHVADEVGYRDVGGGELLDVAARAGKPSDGGRVAGFLDQEASFPGDRGQRVVVDLRAGENGDLRIQQRGHLAEDPALRLTPEPEEDQVLAGQDRIDELRNDRVAVSADSGKEPLPSPEPGDQVRTHFVLDRAARVSARLQRSERGGFRWWHHRIIAMVVGGGSGAGMLAEAGRSMPGETAARGVRPSCRDLPEAPGTTPA